MIWWLSQSLSGRSKTSASSFPARSNFSFQSCQQFIKYKRNPYHTIINWICIWLSRWLGFHSKSPVMESQSLPEWFFGGISDPLAAVSSCCWITRELIECLMFVLGKKTWLFVGSRIRDFSRRLCVSSLRSNFLRGVASEQLVST